MEQLIQAILQISAILYQKLITVPDEAQRAKFIEEIDVLLDQRGNLTEQLVKKGFVYNNELKSHQTLYELDKGIRERMELVMLSIKADMKELQTTKKSEQQYLNPYANVQVMDGMYYDKKK